MVGVVDAVRVMLGVVDGVFVGVCVVVGVCVGVGVGEELTGMQADAPEPEKVFAGQLVHDDAPLPLNVLTTHWLQEVLDPPAENVPGLHA